MQMYYREDQQPQTDAMEHIFQILNDVKTNELTVSDAVDSLAYWYHEAFVNGSIQVEAASPEDLLQGEDLWT
jgi:hypothetical protein